MGQIVSRTNYNYAATRKVIWVGGKNNSRGITIPKSIERELKITDNTQALIYYSPEKRRIMIQLIELGSFGEEEILESPEDLKLKHYKYLLQLKEFLENKSKNDDGKDGINKAPYISNPEIER